MGTGAITEYVDVAQLALYAFWILFFILVGYLHRKASERDGLCRCLRVSSEQESVVCRRPKPIDWRMARVSV